MTDACALSASISTASFWLVLVAMAFAFVDFCYRKCCALKGWTTDIFISRKPPA
jgi:hypothetical protein